MSLLLILLLTFITHCDGETPAMRLLLTDKALQRGRHIGGQWMRETLKMVPIPPVSGYIYLVSLGNVLYNLNGMRAIGSSETEPSFKFDEGGRGLRTVVDRLQVTVSGTWRTQYPHQGFGMFKLMLWNIHVSSGMRLGDDSEGRLTVESTFCSAGFEHLTITLNGEGSQRFQPFVWQYQGRIKPQIERKICPVFRLLVQDMQRQLAAMPVSITVSPTLVVEISLTSEPDVQNSSLGLDWKGEFYHAQNHTEPPFQAKPFVLTPQSNYMVQFGFSEFAVNSASYVYFSSGFIQAQINDSMIPKTFPVRLNTTSFGIFIPQLPKMFPNLLMELQVDAGEVPMFSFISDMVELDLLATVKAFAICPNKTLVPLFKLSANANFSLKVFFSQGKVKGSAAMSNFTMALVSSEVGEFQIAGLESVGKMAVKMVVLPKVNAMLSRGLAIPSLHNIQLVDPVVLVKEGFVVIASDVKI